MLCTAAWASICIFAAAHDNPESCKPSGAMLQVIGHTHAIPDGNRAMAKRVVPQSLGIYDWELALKVNKQKPYFACTGFDCTDLRVLAFTPTMEQLLADTASWLEFSLLLQGLAQLGQLLGRAVAWPSLPCNTAWINPAFIIKWASSTKLYADVHVGCGASYALASHEPCSQGSVL